MWFPTFSSFTFQSSSEVLPSLSSDVHFYYLAYRAFHSVIDTRKLSMKCQTDMPYPSSGQKCCSEVGLRSLASSRRIERDQTIESPRSDETSLRCYSTTMSLTAFIFISLTVAMATLPTHECKLTRFLTSIDHPRGPSVTIIRIIDTALLISPYPSTIF